MNNSPLVTVIAINYNSEPYVLETLESIKQQTYENIQLCIIDDHSTDRSVDLIKQWLQTYQRPYKITLNEKNLGICATLNKVFNQADGKYISATATDDILLPDKISRQVEIMESAPNDVCAVYSNAYLVNSDGTFRDKTFIERRNVQGYPQGNIFETLLTDNFIPAMSVLLKNDSYKAVGNFDENLIYEDYDMWLRLSKKFKFIYSDYISVKYR